VVGTSVSKFTLLVSILELSARLYCILSEVQWTRDDIVSLFRLDVSNGAGIEEGLLATSSALLVPLGDRSLSSLPFVLLDGCEWAVPHLGWSCCSAFALIMLGPWTFPCAWVDLQSLLK
jgi:hypothetical protein